jgi:hypothetical protein
VTDTDRQQRARRYEKTHNILFVVETVYTLAPHPTMEFLLHDHPSLARRINMAEQWRVH